MFFVEVPYNHTVYICVVCLHVSIQCDPKIKTSLVTICALMAIIQSSVYIYEALWSILFLLFSFNFDLLVLLIMVHFHLMDQERCSSFFIEYDFLHILQVALSSEI